MCMVLHQHDHGHGESHHGDSHHGHGHHGNGTRRNSHDDDHDVESGINIDKPDKGKGIKRLASVFKRGKSEGKENRNINVRAAFVHVIGDLIQSIGVLIAGYIVKFWVGVVACLCMCVQIQFYEDDQ